jgi:hypothetical protein
LIVPVGAAAETGGGGELPVYDGLMLFPPIQSAAEPEDFSWRVELSPGESLRLVSETEAAVDHEDGTRDFGITAEGARDAAATAVPTSLEVSGDVVTLVVHHREAAYEYPVSDAFSWILISDESIVPLPLPAGEFERLENLIRQANPAATPVQPNFAAGRRASCEVPSLQGLGLHAARAQLRGAHCAIGQVHLAPGATAAKGKVVKQFRAAGTQLAAGAPVAVKLESR